MIARIRTMRTLKKANRMQADSLAEIRRGLDMIAYEESGHRVGNRPVSEGHFLNASMLILLAMPKEERSRLLASAFGRLNALLAMDEPEPFLLDERVREELMVEITAPESANEEAPGRAGAEGEVNRVGTSRAVPSVNPRRKRPDNRKGTG